MKRPFIAAILSLLALSCASAPKSGKTPEWVLSTPAPDATYTYFVSSSASDSGDVATATQDAANRLISEITRYMGVKVTVETKGEAKAEFDKYSANVQTSVKQEGSSRVAGFAVKEKVNVKDGARVTVYILASYVTADLNKEKARIAALFKEQEDAVAKPEAAGSAALAEGRHFDAVKSFIEAAVAASGSDIDNAEIKLERNINNARKAVAKLRFVKAGAPATGTLGTEFPAPFKAKLTASESDTGAGIPGAELYVTYQRRQATGRVLSKTERIVTDASGTASFTPPAPDFVGTAKLSMSVNLDSARDLLDKIPAKYDALVSALEEDLSKRTVEFEYLVASNAKNVKTGIAIADLDSGGAVLSGNAAQGGVMEALSKQKFQVQLTPLDGKLLASQDDDSIVKAAKAAYGTVITRLVYGIARIESVEKDGSMVTATAKASVKCVDLKTGQVLYSGEKSAVSVASDEAGARRAALVQVSREVLGKDLLANLP